MKLVMVPADPKRHARLQRMLKRADWRHTRRRYLELDPSLIDEALWLAAWIRMRMRTAPRRPRVYGAQAVEE